jgi:hypothetical protein
MVSPESTGRARTPAWQNDYVHDHKVKPLHTGEGKHSVVDYLIHPVPMPKRKSSDEIQESGTPLNTWMG